MKLSTYTALWVALAIVVTSCHPNSSTATQNTHPDSTVAAPRRTITLTDTAGSDTINFGRIHAGEVIQQRILLRNGTSQPMIIVSASTNCGCTGTDYERQPIKPGQTGFFSFQFNSKGFIGYQFKQITLRTTLSSTPFVLILTGEVIE